MLFLVLYPVLSFVFCFVISQVFAMWSKGRGRRVHRIAKALAWLVTVWAVLAQVGALLDGKFDGWGLIGFAMLFLLVVGAWGNVALSAASARVEAAAAAAEGLGISRS